MLHPACRITARSDSGELRIRSPKRHLLEGLERHCGRRCGGRMNRCIIRRKGFAVAVLAIKHEPAELV